MHRAESLRWSPPVTLECKSVAGCRIHTMGLGTLVFLVVQASQLRLGLFRRCRLMLCSEVPRFPCMSLRSGLHCPFSSGWSTAFRACAGVAAAWAFACASAPSSIILWFQYNMDVAICSVYVPVHLEVMLCQSRREAGYIQHQPCQPRF